MQTKDLSAAVTLSDKRVMVTLTGEKTLVHSCATKSLSEY